jgi:hypothetical protein
MISWYEVAGQHTEAGRQAGRESAVGGDEPMNHPSTEARRIKGFN